jgi:hypothetical protein
MRMVQNTKRTAVSNPPFTLVYSQGFSCGFRTENSATEGAYPIADDMDSPFTVRHSFVIRHSCFVIVQRREQEHEHEQK